MMAVCIVSADYQSHMKR